MATSGRDPGDLVGPEDPETPEGLLADATGRSIEFAGEGSTRWPGSIEDRLFVAGYRFDFFQAVRLLQRLGPSPGRVGHDLNPRDEAVRFRAFQTLGFPASAIQEIRRPIPGHPPVLAQNFLGLTGPSGIMPLHYSELLLQYRGTAGGDVPLRDWLDLFNHRLTSFFYRTWEKYRAFPSFERGEPSGAEPDPFTWALLSFVGLGFPSLRDRLVVAGPGPSPSPGRVRIGDQTLLYYSGLLSQRPPNVASLEQLIGGIFGVPAAVDQFQGQWLRLAEGQQTRIGWDSPENNVLGVSAIAGARVWDVQGKFRIRLGPLDYAQFADFLPLDGTSDASGGAIAQLSRLVRLYTGPEFEFDVGLVLRAGEVPGSRLASDDPIGPRLGWNTWLEDQPTPIDRDDASFTDDFPRDY